MSFKRFDAEDNLESGKFYYDVYHTSSTSTDAAVQFSIAYGDLDGSGSLAYNASVVGKSPSSTIYGQYRTLVLGDEESAFNFGGVNQEYFYAITVDRSRYKESLLPGSFNLLLKGTGNRTLQLTDNSTAVTTVSYNDAGRVYQVVSGSNGTPYTGINANGYTATSGSYGLFLPDIGTIILNGAALDINDVEGLNLSTGRSTVAAANPAKLYQVINSGSSFQLNYKETVTSQFVFARVRNSEYNYSTNPSYITGSGDLRISAMLDTPQAYITTVGIYNDNNELLAVAKLSRPLLKDFTKEALIRIKLDF